jgi:hypothetical protein
MRENRNFKVSDVSGPSIWIFILWFKCKNFLLTDILRQIVLLPASLQIVHRYCAFAFGILSMYKQWYCKLLVLTVQSNGSVIAVIKQLLNANAWSCWNISLPYSYTLPYSFDIKNIADLRYVWIPLWSDYWSRSAKHQLINCIHVHEVIQSHFFLYLRRAWGTHLLFESCHEKYLRIWV